MTSPNGFTSRSTNGWQDDRNYSALSAVTGLAMAAFTA